MQVNQEARSVHFTSSPLIREIGRSTSPPHMQSPQGSSSGWTPPTPPQSSSPIRSSAPQVRYSHNMSLMQTSSSSPSHRARHPLTLKSRSSSRRTQDSPQTTRTPEVPGSSPTLRQSWQHTPTVETGSSWHTRFTMQCAQRSREQRKRDVNQRRNGLVNDIVRTDMESREELAIWRRMAHQHKAASEQEYRAELEDYLNDLPTVYELEDSGRYEDHPSGSATNEELPPIDVVDEDALAEQAAQEYEAHMSILACDDALRTDWDAIWQDDNDMDLT